MSYSNSRHCSMKRGPQTQQELAWQGNDSETEGALRGWNAQSRLNLLLRHLLDNRPDQGLVHSIQKISFLVDLPSEASSSSLLSLSEGGTLFVWRGCLVRVF